MILYFMVNTNIHLDHILFGNLLGIDVIASGRNYLPSQNLIVDIEGNTGLATVVSQPIYYTIESASKPKIILLDEPFAGIDPLIINEIKTLIKNLKEKGIGVLISCLLYTSPSPRDRG